MISDSATDTALSVEASALTATGADGEALLEAHLGQLRAMLEQGAVERARVWVQDLVRQWPNDEQVGHYARVLALPRVSVRPGHRGQSRQRERAWLREHARAYPGQWLAVLADQLIAADPDLDAVLTAVRETPGAERALLHFQPGTPD